MSHPSRAKRWLKMSLIFRCKSCPRKLLGGMGQEFKSSSEENKHANFKCYKTTILTHLLYNGIFNQNRQYFYNFRGVWLGILVKANPKWNYDPINGFSDPVAAVNSLLKILSECPHFALFLIHCLASEDLKLRWTLLYTFMVGFFLGGGWLHSFLKLPPKLIVTALKQQMSKASQISPIPPTKGSHMIFESQICEN